MLFILFIFTFRVISLVSLLGFNGLSHPLSLLLYTRVATNISALTCCHVYVQFLMNKINGDGDRDVLNKLTRMT